MKKVIPIVLASFLLSLSVTAWAAVSDSEKLEKEARTINKTASTPSGETAVVERIGKQFNLTALPPDLQISVLHSQSKLGYGEITIVYALAEKLQGGLTANNVNTILTERGQPPHVMGWGEIAKNLKIGKLGPVISSVEKTGHDAHAELMKEERHETMQSREGMGKEERMGGSEHGMGSGHR